MQPVLRPPPRRIRLRLQPPRLIILAAGDAPVGMLLLHHPLQATLAFRVQHLPPVQAVRDDYPALSVLKAVVQPLRVDLLRHPTGIIIPVAALRPPRIMVCHHPPGVLRIISKPANLRPAAVIHRPQFSATFYQQNLKLFIDNDLSLEDGDNNVIIREDIIAQLETAQKIRDIFFSKQNGLGTSFAVETVSLSGNKRRSVLNLDGQLVDYSQGRNYTAHLVWPNNMREGNESKLTLIGTSGNAPRSISFSGPWAQFRLFGAGQLTGVQDGNFTVRFSVDGGAMTYRVHTDTEDNPFSGGLFSQFGLSDTLY